ncbi:uncharacterized protein LOC129956828 [Argiope bruennichi]|uniref:uncharacterized protein LOC129956828 n=1 Tax=Argiope bruennichi TaxID=94029 RepID=UPI0024959999|nr:uncharacterized protein LOC129956828 [Argiope bruennichi]
MAFITQNMVDMENIDDAIQIITQKILTAADTAIPKSSGKIPKLWKPWWNDDCKIAEKKQAKAWNRFRRYPTTDNFIVFKQAKAYARLIRRRSQRITWMTFVNSIKGRISSKLLWDKVRKMSGLFKNEFPLTFLNSNGQLITDIKAIANTLGVKGSLYVDDFQIHCSSEDMGLIREKLQEAINNICEWGKINGFTISSQKSAAIHFCRRRGLHPDPKLKLNNQLIPFVSEIKFLGMILDSKLTFKPHIDYLKRKGTLSMNIMKILSNLWYGAESGCLLKIYRALIRSKIDYGSAIYGSASKSTLRPLDTIHNQSLRLSIGAFRTSPVMSLNVACNEPPLKHRRNMLALNLFLRIKSDDSHPLHYKVINPIYSSLFALRSSFIPTFGFRIGQIFRDLGIEDFPVLNKSDEIPPWKNTIINFIDAFEKWRKPTTLNFIYQSIFNAHRQQFSNYEAVFTDGSKAGNNVGAAVMLRHEIFSEKLHSFCSVFTSEIYAIYRALIKIAEKGYKRNILYTDSKSAIEALKNVSPSSHPIVVKCVEYYLYLSEKGIQIIFCWIPGHSGIQGNERVDNAARSCTALIENFVPLNDALQAIKNQLAKRWQNVWDQQDKNKLHEVQPLLLNMRRPAKMPKMWQKPQNQRMYNNKQARKSPMHQLRQRGSRGLMERM